MKVKFYLETLENPKRLIYGKEGVGLRLKTREEK